VRHTTRVVLALTFLTACAFSCWAVGDEDPFAFDIGLRLFGADIGIGYRGLALLPNADTTIWAYVGGGYETEHYYRDPSGDFLAPGSLAPGGVFDGLNAAFQRIEGAWRLGVDQGFAWNDRTKTNLVEAFLFYRGRYDINQIQPGLVLYNASILDKDGILLNTLQAGLGYNDLLFNKKNKTQSGFAAEASAEWGPAFFFNTLIGNSDFIRFNATFRAFLPLYDAAPSGSANLLSIYAGEFAAIDYAIGIGQAVPLYIRQSFGGRIQTTGLGGDVRGVDNGGYDANLKAVNNLELRVNLPSICWPDLVPGVVVFFDAGYYDQVGEIGTPTPTPSGIVASTGAGIYIDLLDLASIAAYVEYRLDSINADGQHLWPFNVEFGMHF